MKANQVQIGEVYIAKVSGYMTRVKITSPNPNGGWWAVNMKTDRMIRIKTAARLQSDYIPWEFPSPMELSQSHRIAQLASEQLETETQKIIDRTGGVSNEPTTL